MEGGGSSDRDHSQHSNRSDSKRSSRRSKERSKESSKERYSKSRRTSTSRDESDQSPVRTRRRRDTSFSGSEDRNSRPSKDRNSRPSKERNSRPSRSSKVHNRSVSRSSSLDHKSRTKRHRSKHRSISISRSRSRPSKDRFSKDNSVSRPSKERNSRPSKDRSSKDRASKDRSSKSKGRSLSRSDRDRSTNGRKSGWRDAERMSRGSPTRSPTRPTRRESPTKRESLNRRSSASRRRSTSRSRRSRSSHGRSRRSSPAPPEKKKKTSKWDMPCEEGPAMGYGMSALMMPLEDRRGRRLYIGNLPAGVSEQAIVQFFNGAMLAAAGVEYSVAAAAGQFPVLKAEIGPRRPDVAGQADHRYCFLEYRTIADANICLKLDGISFNGFMLKVGRPNDYTIVPNASEISTGEALAAAAKGIIPFTKPVPETCKMYVQDLPSALTDDQLREMCEHYGTVKSAVVMKDLRTGQSMGCAVVQFDDPRHIDEAVAGLDRQPIDGQTPRFSKGTLMSQGKVGLSTDCFHTSSIATELPTSMTHKVLSNAMIGAQVKAARHQGAVPSPVVQLLNTVFAEDLIKDDEYNAILKDVKEEASQYGTLLEILVPRPPPDLSMKEGVGKIFLHFSDLTAARRCQAELNGRRFEQRRVICAAFYPLERFKEGKLSLI